MTLAEGLRGSNGQFAAPPYSNGPYTWDQQLTFKGNTRFHKRPTSDDYVIQLRSTFTGTSGTHWGVDAETHLIASGTASLRSVQGVAVLDATFTSTNGTLIGVYGQARADGTFNAAAGFMAGGYFLIEASAAITASHVASLWVDSHQANAVTGNHELIYATNNGAAVMDSVMYVYGGNSITNLFTLNTVGGMVADATGQSMTITKKIKLDIDGSTVYLQAGTMA
jgi:hypothetical protein